MKDFLSFLAYGRTAYGQSGARHLGIVLLGLFVYLAGCSAFAASMEFTVRDCTGMIQDFTRIPERSIPEVGGQVTEFTIILNAEAALRAFARGGNVEFGGALSVAAGPVGQGARELAADLSRF